jgi:phage-related protein
MAKATNVGAVSVDLTLNDTNYDKQLNSKIKSSENAFSSSFKKIGGIIAGAFAVKQVAAFTKECISSASKVQSAFTGLNSIVQGTGNSFAQAQDFINKYTADGLVSIEETATAYKNLLSRGYDASQIEDVLSRLKDSAAFGRQASYDLGEAVVTATEGLKNENSILVDNAGVTKNVAKMWEEYAKSIGKSSNDLTQAEKIQAEYNGIMNETRFQVGDAAAYTKTFSGQIQQLKFNFNQMTVAIGKVVTPIAQLFIPVINSAINAITSLFKKLQVVMSTFGLKMPDVVQKTSNSISMIGASAKDSAKDAVASAKKISKAFSGLDEINVLKPSSSADSSSDTSGGGVMNVDNTSIAPTMDDSKLLSCIENVKNKIKEMWNSAPVQSFVGAVTSAGNFIWEFWKTLGENFVSNVSTTWNNIKNSVSNSVSNMSVLWTNFWNDTKLAIDAWGPQITSGVAGVFNSIWVDTIDPAIQIITSAWEDFTKILSDLWDEYGEPLVNNIGEFVQKTIDLFQSIWDNVLEPIITPFLETLSWLWDEHLKGLIEEVSTFILKLTNGALEIYNNVIEPIVSWLLEKLSPAFTYIGGLITGVFGTVVSFISDAVKSIFKIFGGIIDFITGVFTGNWKKAWNGVKNVFKGIFDGLVNVFKTPINFIIDGINAFIKGLNKIKIPDWVPVVGGKGFNMSTIPKLAQGGYARANNPQLAIVGDNKREGEIISPESKIYEQTKKAILDAGSNVGKQELEITIYHKYEDGKTIIQKINQAQIDAGRVLVLS